VHAEIERRFLRRKALDENPAKKTNKPIMITDIVLFMNRYPL